VSRYGGQYEHVFESVTAGVHINCAQLDINTVAAGGGSMLFWRNGLFVVGPESAGAHPGPACYRKGGPLTITDANLILGRLLPEHFPKIFGPNEDQPLGIDVARKAFEELAVEINSESGQNGRYTVEAIALGFLHVANINMTKPIRTLTESRGYDVTSHNLASFGGAGGQHACDIAEGLGIKRVIIHRYSSILSAYGMALADLVSEAQVPCSLVYEPSNMDVFSNGIATLKKKVLSDLTAQGVADSAIEFESYLNMRYQGSDSQIMTLTPDDSNDYLSVFRDTHQREFSFTSDDRQVIVDDIRVRGTGNSNKIVESSPFEALKSLTTKAVNGTQRESTTKVYYETGWHDTPVYLLGKLNTGDVVQGPAMIIDQTQTIVVVPNATGTILSRHVIIHLEFDAKKEISALEADPIHLSIFGHRFMSIAEDMGRTLQKISVSTNVKERLDFSCALFDSDGGLTANAPHVPVHLGSMSRAVTIAMERWKGNLYPGDCIATNHPVSGGTHLPDITLISPVFEEDGKTIHFWVAARAHHAEIGGIAAGSMPSDSTELYQEGVAFEQWKIISEGKFDNAVSIFHFAVILGANSFRASNTTSLMYQDRIQAAVPRDAYPTTSPISKPKWQQTKSVSP
jgi:5-oxoprolinase (ATP-hydrolysing)